MTRYLVEYERVPLVKKVTSIEQIVIPEIYCPFPSRISPHYEQVRAHTLDWARRFEVVYHPEMLRYYDRADLSGLACRVYPHAGLEELCLASDWLFFIFVFDDLFDEGGLDHRLNEMAQFHEHLLDVVHNPPRGQSYGPISRVFLNLFQRAGSSVSPAWHERFERHNEEFFKAQRWQIANRESQRLPNFQECLENRVHGAGVLPVFDLIEVMQHVEIPAEIYESQLAQAILQAGNNIVGWTNDVYSFKKDAGCSDVNSALAALQCGQGISLQQAVDQMCAMIDRETRRFLDLLRLVSFPSEVSEQHMRFLWTGVADWLRGHLDWYSGNSRYADGAFLVGDQPTDLLLGQEKNAS